MSGAGAAPWTAAIDRLRDDAHCPVCGTTITGARCAQCSAALDGPEAQLLRRVSQVAAVALERRERIVAGLAHDAARAIAGAQQGSGGGHGIPAHVHGSVVAPAVPVAVGAVRPVPAAEDSAPLQSVLSVAGAGLFGIAAIVFSFFTPDLAQGVRGAIVAATGALFLGGGVLLARRGLRFSAETVGGLALVFGALSVQTAATVLAPVLTSWFVAAVLTAIASVALLLLARRTGLRIWLWAATLGIAAVPAMLGGALGTGDGVLLGFLGVAFVALAEVAVLPRLGAARVAENRFAAERGSLIAAQGVAIGIVLVMSAANPLLSGESMPVLALAAVLVAVHALLATKNGAAVAWSVVAGVAGAGAPVLVVLSAVPGMAFAWFVVVCATGVGAGLVLLGAVLPLPGSARRGAVIGGALGVLVVALMPGTMFALVTGGSALARLIGRGSAGAVATGASSMPSALGWALLCSLAIGALALGACARLAGSRVHPVLRSMLGTVAIAPGSLAVLAVGASALLPLVARIALLLGCAVATVLRVRTLSPDARAWHSGAARTLLLIAALAAVVLSAMIGSEDPAVMPAAGMATLAAAFVLGGALPAAWRFPLVAAGFGYALVLVSETLALAGLGGVALLSLTATAGLLVLAVATVMPRVGARSWQAMLVVAAVPFALGVAQVLVERSGWTALPTATAALLATLLTGTRRAGLTAAVRLFAAAVVVPALAVTVLCLGAQLLPMSASPVVLPLIAALVAVALAGTARIRRALTARGLGRILAMRVQSAIEASALLTGALAVLLAVVREAAGFGTACAVLALLSAGAAVAAATTGRRHLRAVAAVAATGALWSAWASLGIEPAEAYLLPPAVALVVLGVVQALRGRPSTVPAVSGLALAILPVLLLVGAGDARSVPRTVGLVAASGILSLAVGVLGRRIAGGGSVALRRLRPVSAWFAVAAMVAGLAGPAQALLIARGHGAAAVMAVPPRGAGLFLFCLGVSAAGRRGWPPPRGRCAPSSWTTGSAHRGGCSPPPCSRARSASGRPSPATGSRSGACGHSPCCCSGRCCGGPRCGARRDDPAPGLVPVRGRVRDRGRGLEPARPQGGVVLAPARTRAAGGRSPGRARRRRRSRRPVGSGRPAKPGGAR